MRKTGQLLALLALVSFCHVISGQVSITIQNGKPEKPVVGLPIIADQSVRIVTHLANGMAVTRELKGRIYRSADGLERYQGTVVSTDPANPSPTMMAYIIDRVKRTAVLLNSKLLTATTQHLPDNATVTISFLPLQVPTQYRTIKLEDVSTSDIGKHTQDGLELTGKRTTGNIPVGKIGNDQPLQVITEEWLSQQQKLIIKQVEQNPLSGERTFELTNIRSEEPDPALFEIPKGYTVKEQAPVSLGTPTAIKESAPPNVGNAFAQAADPRVSAQVPTTASTPAMASSTPQATASAQAISDVPYAAEPLVIEHSDSIFSMAADGTGWIEHSLVARLQSDATVKQYGVLTVPYASNTEHVELNYARIRHPDGTVVDTPTSEAMDMPGAVMRQAPFYSDQKELQLPIHSLRVGDTLEFKYRIVRTKAIVPGQFWGQEVFSNSAVVLSQTAELRVPAGMVVNVWSPTLKPVESTAAATAGTAAEHIYLWSHSQLKPTAGKEAEAAAEAKKKILWTADQELDLEQGSLPTIAWSTFKSWEEIGTWYRSLESDRIVPDDAVKAKAAQLTAGKTSDEDKVRALYDYVATNIRYIGVAFGIGRFQPHTAAEILANQYGDCKDKHTLLAALLSSVGIQSDAVLIGAGIRFNEAVPSPAAFNHLITHLTLAGKPVWLDTTAEVAPFGMLVLTTRDKQALVISPGTGIAPAIVRTPVDPLVPDAVTMDAAGSLDSSGVSTSHILLTFHGDGEIATRAVFRQIAPAQYNQVVQVFSTTIGLPGTVTNPDLSRPDDTTQPFKMAYDFKREKAGDWDHLKTIPQVMPVVLPRVTEIDPPNHAIQLGSPRTSDSTSAMKLPDGWSAILPATVHASCAYGTYDMTYRLENGTVYAERRLAILAKKVPVSDWKAYKEWVDKVNPGREPYIQLVTAVAAKLPEERTKQIEDALNSSDPVLKNNLAYSLANKNEHLTDAQTLAEEAVQMQEKITSKQVSMDDKVKSFDQMQSLGTVWETLGWVYFRQGEQQKAATYMHAAWELKPRNVEINMFMGIIDDALHKPEEATTFYRMALNGTIPTSGQTAIQSRFDRLGITTNTPLPMDVVTTLPALSLHLNPGDAEPVVDILLSPDKAPAIKLLQGDHSLEKPLEKAIQSALANAFPDSGPEKLLRRAGVTCTTDDKPVCALHFHGSQVAMEESKNGK